MLLCNAFKVFTKNINVNALRPNKITGTSQKPTSRTALFNEHTTKSMVDFLSAKVLQRQLLLLTIRYAFVYLHRLIISRSWYTNTWIHSCKCTLSMKARLCLQINPYLLSTWTSWSIISSAEAARKDLKYVAGETFGDRWGWGVRLKICRLLPAAEPEIDPKFLDSWESFWS